MAGVERRAAVVAADVIRVGRKAGNPRDVTVGVVERVKTKELDLRPHSHVRINDELVLMKVAFGDVFEDVSPAGIRAQLTAGRPGKGRVGIDGKELIEAARVQIRNRQSCRFGKLPLAADS